MKTYTGCSITIATPARYRARAKISADFAVRFPGLEVDFVTEDDAANPYLVGTSIKDWHIEKAPKAGELVAAASDQQEGGMLFQSARDALADTLSMIR